jgi:hypothetical protein
MSNSESSKSVNYQGLALTSLIVGAVATGVGLVSAKPATAGENPRISVAVTNIQSNTSSQSFAAEIVAPATDRYFTTGTVTVNYATVGLDPSQVVINDANLAATPATYNATTVESATARAINGALGLNRYGDVIGLVNAYNGPSASAENPSASVALTNIQSNSNSQSFAAEIVAPFANFDISAVGVASGGLTYGNAVNALDDSQIFLLSGTVQATINAFTNATTVDAATARAIDGAVGATRYGDIIGIVDAYGNKGFAAGAENPSVSVALTNIQSNTNSQSFAAEIVAPETGVYFSIATGTITYATVAGTLDASQVQIATGAITATASTNTSSTVERSVTNAIDTAGSTQRYGDVMGIVKAWQGGSSAALD